MDIQSILLILTVIINVILVIVVFAKNRKDKVGRWFAIFVATLILWTITMFFYRLADNTQKAFLWAILLYESALLIPPALLYFILIFPEGKLNIKKYIHLASLLPVAVLVYLTAIKGSVIAGVEIVPGAEKEIKWGSYYLAYNVYFILYFGAAYIILGKNFLNASGILKKQIKFIFFGTLIPALIANTTNLLLPTAGFFYFNWVGQITTIVIAASIFYAILKHHLLNIKVIATEAFTILIIAVLLVDAFLSDSKIEFLLKFILFVFVAFFGYLLIKSVVDEIRSKERIAKISADLKRANVELRRLDRAKSEFLSIASHQLRTPLTAIKGYSSMLLEGEYGRISKEVKDVLGKVFQSSHRLTMIVDDFLNISRIEAGEMKYDFSIFDLQKILEGIINDFMTNSEKARQLKLEFVYDKKEKFMITADQNKIAQVVTNIIDNAIKYTPAGSVKVSLTKNKTTNTILAKVEDTGIGIEKNVMPRLFQKFSRAKKVSRLHTDGSGLGLFVAKRIIEDHRGKVWVESKGENKGSTFFVELPAS